MVVPADFQPPALRWQYLQSQSEKAALLQPILNKNMDMPFIIDHIFRSMR